MTTSADASAARARAWVGVGGQDVAMVTWEAMLAYCLAKAGAWRDEPWEGDVVVKVGPKIFAFLGSPGSAGVGLKCGSGREEADEWRMRYPRDVKVSPYIGRSGWNVLAMNGAVPADELFEAVDESYALVVAGLPKKHRPQPGETRPSE